MTVSQLIQQLRGIDGDLPVIARVYDGRNDESVKGEIVGVFVRESQYSGMTVYACIDAKIPE